jgi:hypothetical protein
MTRDEVLALARQVGLWEMLEGYSSEYGSLDAEEDCLPNLQRFAALVAAHEREECAKAIDDIANICVPGSIQTVLREQARCIRSRT